MERFGSLETRSQFSLLNNINERGLLILCKKRGIDVRGIKRKYDLMVLFIQWYNNINYYRFNNKVHGFIVTEKGPRKHMEDNYIIDHFGKLSIYGVFDGHGGNYISKRLCEFCKTDLLPQITYHKKLNSNNIIRGFLNIDNKFYNLWKRNVFGTDGSTASLVIADKNILYFVNLGDSRTVLYYDNGIYYSTRDHKPTRKDELERINKTKYDVIVKDVGRIGGLLALSRSFGDFIYKIDDKDNYRPEDYAVSVIPEIDRVDISGIKHSHIKTIISATDGLWDVFTNEEVFNFIQFNRKRGLKYKTILRNLVNLAYERGSTDNITIVLVEL